MNGSVVLVIIFYSMFALCQQKTKLIQLVYLSATVTETQKGELVLEKGTQFVFPFQNTSSILARSAAGRFEHRKRNDDNEARLQRYFINQCQALKELDSIYFDVYDTSKTPLLATRKPDFVIVHEDHALDALNVVVGEIRKQKGIHFSKADIGHCISFGEKALQLQPQRAFIYVLLTDCIVLAIFKIT